MEQISDEIVGLIVAKRLEELKKIKPDLNEDVYNQSRRNIISSRDNDSLALQDELNQIKDKDVLSLIVSKMKTKINSGENSFIDATGKIDITEVKNSIREIKSEVIVQKVEKTEDTLDLKKLPSMIKEYENLTKEEKGKIIENWDNLGLFSKKLFLDKQFSAMEKIYPGLKHKVAEFHAAMEKAAEVDEKVDKEYEERLKNPEFREFIKGYPVASKIELLSRFNCLKHAETLIHNGSKEFLEFKEKYLQENGDAKLEDIYAEFDGSYIKSFIEENQDEYQDYTIWMRNRGKEPTAFAFFNYIQVKTTRQTLDKNEEYINGNTTASINDVRNHMQKGTKFFNSFTDAIDKFIGGKAASKSIQDETKSMLGVLGGSLSYNTQMPKISDAEVTQGLVSGAIKEESLYTSKTKTVKKSIEKGSQETRAKKSELEIYLTGDSNSLDQDSIEETIFRYEQNSKSVQDDKKIEPPNLPSEVDNSFIGKIKRVLANMRDSKDKDSSKGFFSRLKDSVQSVFGNKKSDEYSKKEDEQKIDNLNPNPTAQLSLDEQLKQGVDQSKFNQIYTMVNTENQPSSKGVQEVEEIIQ